jgi:hypothetical protein
MRPRSSLTTLLVLLAAALPTLAAQELSPEALQAIHSASRARVRLAGEGWRPLTGTTADSAGTAGGALLYVGSGRAGQPAGAVPIDKIAQVQVRAGSHAGNGARIGGAVGLGLAAVTLLLASTDEWTSPTGGQVVSGLIGTTLFGAGVGALVGSASPRWRTVYGVDPP